MKVMVCQRPVRHLGVEALAARCQPRSGAILVFVQVSSMNTTELDRSDPDTWPTAPAGERHRGDPASAAISVFFITKLLCVKEIPHRAVINLQATLGEFGYQPAHGKIRFRHRCTSQSRCGPAIFLADTAIWSGLTLPVWWKRCTQLIAVLMPTPNWAAA